MKRIISLILSFMLVAAIPLTLASCDESMGTGACEYAESRDITGHEVYYVEMSVKNCGKMVILLDATTAPITVANFLKLVNEGFYDGLTFHRIIEDFMIQGGDPDANGLGGSSETIKGEFAENGYYNDIPHIEGVISMARSNDPDSASSQFFICNADARASLDGKYAAFGYVVEGLSTVHEITKLGMPKTKYYEFYGTEYHYYWSYYGNGAIENKSDQPVINYIKVLEDYVPGEN